MVDLNLLESGNVWKLIGMKIFRDAEGRLGVHVKNIDELRQVYGAMHGGIIATAIDAAVAVAVNDVYGKNFAASTVELKVNYLLPMVDPDLFVFASLVKKGKQIAVATAEAIDGQKKLIAIGIATYMVKSID